MILVVDDNPITAEGLAAYVTSRGRTVTAALTAAEARAQLARGGWSCLVLDELLPDGSGLSLVRGLRAEEDYTPAVVLTGLDGQAVDGLRHAVISEGLGPCWVRQKPVEPEELMTLIEVLSRKEGGA